LALIATNILTALVTATVTSFFWIAAYQQGRASESEPDPVTSAAVRSGPAVRYDASATRRSHRLVLGPTGVAIPVLGIAPKSLADTFSQARAGGARVHDAIDIMAAAGTPVVSAAPGVVEKLYFSEGGGGITAYVRSTDGRWSYYYAHLRDYAPGLREGQRLNQGDPIGTVGSTGNANPDGPHLHFAIRRMKGGERWHQGVPINPYPLLAGRNPAR
jgi:murein DD-endopeptidase MepM/ murein hydrolase activator NlpD